MIMAEPVLAFDRAALVLGERRALDDVDFAIGAGERLAIIGADGSGKSLILRLAAGLLHPSSGSVRLFGEDLATAPTDRLRRLRACCGLVLQGGSLLGTLSIEDNLRLAMGRGGAMRADRSQRRLVRATLDFDLGHVVMRPAASVSDGERQRAELARAFLRDPDLVILDEPFERAHGDAGALEAIVRRKIVSRERAMLLLTRDEALAERIASRIMRLRDGRLA